MTAIKKNTVHKTARLRGKATSQDTLVKACRSAFKCICLTAGIALMQSPAGAQTYWDGENGNSWAGANWTPDPTGATPNVVLGANADVVFSTLTPANTATILGGNQSISSLTVNDSLGISISNDTLTISGAGGIDVNVSSGPVTINSNVALTGAADTIEVDTLDGVVINGAVSGTNGLIKEGIGQLTLAGTNVYTGDTTINGGTLRVGNGTTGSLDAASVVNVGVAGALEINLAAGGVWSNSVVNDGTVEWISDSSNTQASTSVISGTGSLESSSLGTTVLLGTNTYTGATLVSDGILQIGDGTTGSINELSEVTVDLGAELHINLADLSEWENDVINNGEVHWISSGINIQSQDSVISGTGSMEITATGVTILAADNTFSGGTTINTPGEVLVASAFDNFSTAFGSGTLEIQQGTVDTFFEQTLQINVGGYIQSGGEIAISLKGTNLGQYTQYNVLGGAALSGGIVSLYDGTGTYVPEAAWAGNPTGDVQTIIQTTTGVTGQFASNFPVATIYNTEFDQTFVYAQGQTLLYPTITYDVNTADVTWVRDSYQSVPGLTRNQRSVAGGLDGFAFLNAGNAGGALTFLNGQAIGSLAGLYDLIAPEELTAIFQMGFHASEMQAASIVQHLDYVRQGARRPMGDKESQTITASAGGKHVEEPAVVSQEGRWNLFIEGLGGNADVGSTSNATGYDFDMFGAMMGADYLVNERFAIGITGGYLNSDASLINGGNIETDSYRGALYGTFFDGGFYLDGLVGLAYNSYDTDRLALLGRATGDTEGLEFTSMLNTGYDFHSGNLTFGPVASVAYTRVNMDGFSESGSLTPLSYSDQEQESLRTNLGARISYVIPAGRVRITPQARVTWQHEFMDATQSIDSSFSSGPGPVFTVDGPEMGRDSALVTAGLTVQFNPSVAAYAFYTGQLGRTNYDSHNVTVGVRISF